jgi:hypothetical protein
LRDSINLIESHYLRLAAIEPHRPVPGPCRRSVTIVAGDNNSNKLSGPVLRQGAKKYGDHV